MLTTLVVVVVLAAAPPPIDYRVKVSPNAETLDVQVHGATVPLTLDDNLHDYVDKTDGGYRVRLGEAGRALQSRRYAFTDGEGVYAAPSSWLIHPLNPADGARFTLHVETPKGLSFITGLHPTADGYEGPLWALNDAPWSGFAAFDVTTATWGGASIETAIAPGELALTHDQIRAWVERSANLVAAYYGRFPVTHAAIMVIPGKGNEVGFGTAMGNGGAAVLVWVGAKADVDALKDDWVLPHEMIHFATPNLPRANTWLEEGISTYVEPLIRTRKGEMTPEDFWRQMIDKLPQGLPKAGDEGLDRTPTWGRTYWGGALFCLLADVELRERSKGKAGLDTALRGVNAAGGTQEVMWTLDRTLKAGDAATGLDVLTKLHAKLGNSAGDVDLTTLFKRLGVAISRGRVTFDDSAPLAGVRKAMTGP